MFGITLAGLAVIVWSLRSSEQRAQQKLVASLAVANVFIAVFSFGQWRTVWGTRFGILTAFVFAFLALMSLIRVAEMQRDLRWTGRDRRSPALATIGVCSGVLLHSKE